ncbi:hypothetical protein BKA70DRAFT_1576663 [Coprinopsis sp. MPI-PUGE-AT-0042]|nr:hypothetical protein BKA70DRAFT_1576663 [Coprinopsis sp. MPI-PUGE-AT-0042]
MHRCLWVQEIVSNIFEAVYRLSVDLNTDEDDDGDEWCPSRTDTLAALARTCKCFNYQATKILWRDLPGLYPIIFLMERSRYEIEDEFTICLKGTTLSAKFIKRLKLYAPLVKKIRVRYVPECDYEVFHPSALLVLNSSSAVPIPLFPNLERVELNCDDSNPMEALFYPAVVLGSSRLTDVTVFTNDRMRYGGFGRRITKSDKAHWEAFADRLIPFAHQLRKFSFKTRIDVEPLATPALTRLCCSLSYSMTHLAISNIELPYTAITTFGSLCRLEHLGIAINDRNFGSSVALRDDYFVFPALRVLYIELLSLPSGRKFLSIVDAGRLEELDISIAFEPMVSGEIGISPLLDPLVDWTSTRTLKTIHVRGSSLGRYESRFQLAISDATFRSLAIFRNITDFRVDPCVPHLSDEGLLVVFSSWRSLQHFAMSGNGLIQEVTELSLTGVHRALKQCPRLKLISLACDCRELPYTADIQPHDELSGWSFGCSPITCGRSFVEWAMVHLPKLHWISSFQDLERRALANFDGTWPSARQSMVYLAQWNDVSKLLEARQQEEMESLPLARSHH